MAPKRCRRSTQRPVHCALLYWCESVAFATRVTLQCSGEFREFLEAYSSFRPVFLLIFMHLWNSHVQWCPLYFYVCVMCTRTTSSLDSKIIKHARSTSHVIVNSNKTERASLSPLLFNRGLRCRDVIWRRKLRTRDKWRSVASFPPGIHGRVGNELETARNSTRCKNLVGNLGEKSPGDDDDEERPAKYSARIRRATSRSRILVAALLHFRMYHPR